MIWKREFTLENLNNRKGKNLVNHLGIVFIEKGPDFLTASMPVDERTIQPFGILHGGASVSLAETIGSVASLMCIDQDSGKIPVGISINANHIKSVRNGKVSGTAKPIRLGSRLHVWEIIIKDEKSQTVCVSRLTTMIIQNR